MTYEKAWYLNIILFQQNDTEAKGKKYLLFVRKYLNKQGFYIVPYFLQLAPRALLKLKWKITIFYLLLAPAYLILTLFDQYFGTRCSKTLKQRTFCSITSYYHVVFAIKNFICNEFWRIFIQEKKFYHKHDLMKKGALIRGGGMNARNTELIRS